jgi:hypothetical protein
MKHFTQSSKIEKAIFVFTDASNYAADYVLLQEKNQAVHVMFNNHEKQQNSTFRKLKAVEIVS